MSHPRLQSLDAFRGLTIAGMILVNNPGSWSFVYPPLRHAEWHGWTPTDLIFPFFLFIVGVAMAFSLLPRLEAGTPPAILLRSVAKRSLIIIGLGLFMSAWPRFDFGTMRFPGVLQRIGVAFFLASLCLLYLKPRAQAIVAIGLVLGYWALMTLIPVPGFGPGDLSPEGNLAAWLDRAFFDTHLWQDTWDPEGFLSTLPAVATTLSGLFVGYLLRSSRPGPEITNRLFGYGWCAILVGVAWGVVFPINKNLWTSSYVVFTTGAAMQFLGLCYWLVEVRGHTRWAWPAVVFGRNAIAVFVLSGLVAKTLILITFDDAGRTTSAYGWIYRHLFVPWAGEMNGSLAFAFATILFWFGAMAWLYRRNLFIKV